MASRCILQIYNPIPRLEKVCQGKGFISGKLPMTEDEDRTFVKYTIVAMVHMIYKTGKLH